MASAATASATSSTVASSAMASGTPNPRLGNVYQVIQEFDNRSLWAQVADLVESEGGTVSVEHQMAISLQDPYEGKLMPAYGGDPTPEHIALVLKESIAFVSAAMRQRGVTFTNRGALPDGNLEVEGIGVIQLEGTDPGKARDALANAVAITCGMSAPTSRRRNPSEATERAKLLQAAGINLSAELELNIPSQLSKVVQLIQFLRINQDRQSPDEPHPWIQMYASALSTLEDTASQTTRKRTAEGQPDVSAELRSFAAEVFKRLDKSDARVQSLADAVEEQASATAKRPRYVYVDPTTGQMVDGAHRSANDTSAQPTARSSGSTDNVFQLPNGELKPLSDRPPFYQPIPVNTKIQKWLKGALDFTYENAYKELQRTSARPFATESPQFTVQQSSDGSVSFQPTTTVSGSSQITSAAAFFHVHTAIGREIYAVCPESVGWFTDLAYRYSELLLTNPVCDVVDIANLHLASFLGTLRGESVRPMFVFNDHFLVQSIARRGMHTSGPPSQSGQGKGKKSELKTPGVDNRPMCKYDEAKRAQLSSVPCKKAMNKQPCFYRDCPFNHDGKPPVPP